MEQDKCAAAAEPLADRSKREQADAAAGCGEQHAAHLGALELGTALGPEFGPLSGRSVGREAFALLDFEASAAKRHFLAVNVNAQICRQTDDGEREPQPRASGNAGR